MRILPLTIVLLGILGSLQSCGELVEPDAPLGPVSYTDQIEPLLKQNCVRCHGGVVTNSIDLSNYNSIQALVGNDPSEDVIVVGDPSSRLLRLALLPQTGPMYAYLNDPEDYDLLYEWIVVDSLAYD